MMEYKKQDLERRMQSALEAVLREFGGLRTSRASVSFLDPIKVEAYGSLLPLSQVGTVHAPEARLLTVQVWDKDMVKKVEKAIREADLGLNPSSDGQIIRILLPDLSQERRQELVKLAGRYAEQGRVAIRNIRRDGMEALKKAEKEKIFSEDEGRRQSHELQMLTDEFIKKIDDGLGHKEKDILQF